MCLIRVVTLLIEVIQFNLDLNQFKAETQIQSCREKKKIKSCPRSKFWSSFPCQTTQIQTQSCRKTKTKTKTKQNKKYLT